MKLLRPPWVAVIGALFGALAQAHTPPQWSQTGARAEILDSDASAGVLASTVSGARLLSPDARLRWQIDLCPVCANPAEPDLIVAGALFADGSAWLLASRIAASTSPYRLLHVLPNGVTGANIDIDEPDHNYLFAARLLADANQVVVLLANRSRLRRIRFDGNGTLREMHDYPLAETRDSIFYTAQRLLDDGGFAFVAYTQNREGCDFSPPICPIPDIDVFRINADGTDRWNVSFPASVPFVALDADGGALLAYPAIYPMFDQPRLHDIDANGHVSVPRPIAADLGIRILAGPVNGHYFGLGWEGQYLIDRSGALVHFDANERYGQTVTTHGEHGFLVSGLQDDSADVGLLDPDTLALRGEFDIGHGQPYSSSVTWSLAPDGSVYGAGEANPFDQPPFDRIARFAVPGSPADDRLFLDRFE